jgi:CubicO group peptidase (beta-lactamase class C family)
MKAYRFFTQWACLLLVGMSSLHGNSMVSSDQTNYAAVDEYITARMRSDHIPGVALAIVKGDQIVYLKGYGRADQSGRAVTPQTPFIIGPSQRPSRRWL